MNYLCFQEDCLLLFSSDKPTKTLSFKYSPFRIQQQSNARLRSPDLHFSALLGIKILDDIPFLLIAEDAELCCNIGKASVFEIKKIDWVPVVRREELQAVLDRNEDKIKDMAKLFDDGCHYYSNDYRLNTTYYFNITSQQNIEQRKFYSQFIFNESLMQITEQQRIDNWCKPIIQGYIEQYQCPITTKQSIIYTLISRRSNKKQGTRYFARGIDDKGNVANFTETQQIISYGGFMISHLQIRGSVPAFFQQLGVSGLSGQLNIVRNQAMTQKAFQLHFSKLNSAYGRIFCVNLLSIKKSQQQKLTIFFETLISKFSPPYIRYEYFDFHEQCKNNKFENSQRLIQKIKKVISNFGITVFDVKLKKIIAKQSGVVRTNCLDCLDRTNYMQSRIALYVLERTVQNFSAPQVRDEINRYESFKNKVEDSSEVLKKFNSCWADNGDKISLHYTGIGSTHTDITKLGKRTLKGTVNHKMRSLMRFFVQFSDHKKHQAIQTMVTNPLLRSNSLSQAPLHQFINVALFSYNLDDQQGDLGSNRNKLTQDYIQLKKPPAVLVYGYRKQQSSLLTWFKTTKPHQDITRFAQQQIAVLKRLKYQIVKKVLNENNCMIIFGNQLVVQNVTQIKHQNVGNNKDIMTVCKFNLFGSSMVFSGVNNSSFQKFVQNLEKSHEQAFQYDRLGQAKSSSILTHHYRTIIGNTSSGNKLPKQHISQITKQIKQRKGDTKRQQKLISQMLDGDQLSMAILQNNKYLKNYMEAPLYFAPAKNRILFWNKEQVVTKVLEYGYVGDCQCVYAHISYELK